MLADVSLPERLLHFADPEALTSVVAALHAGWRTEAQALLADPRWRGQLLACAAIVIEGSDPDLDLAVWRALDGGSWVAPQLVVTAFLLDPEFEARAEERLLSVTRRGPKVIAALVRAYHRLPKPRMNVVAQLGRHDPLLATEDGRTGIAAVDDWLDHLPRHCDATMQGRWLRRPRQLAR